MASDLKFDTRNPLKLAADEPPPDNNNDDVLEADVIGRARPKRGVVKLDGYESDSDNDHFDRHLDKKTKQVREDREAGETKEAKAKDEDDMFADGDDMVAADNDMFADDDNGDQQEKEGAKAAEVPSKKKKKKVQFLDVKDIEGQDETSKDRGQLEGSSDDESDLELAIQEEGLDEEVGPGGLKRNAPKIEAFNMAQEQEDGRFDEAGNYVRKAVDPEAVHDRWLDGVSKKQMRQAAEAHQRREEQARSRRIREDKVLVKDLLARLILRLERWETPLEALARLGRRVRKEKKTPRRRPKKRGGAVAMDIDREGARRGEGKGEAGREAGREGEAEEKGGADKNGEAEKKAETETETEAEGRGGDANSGDAEQKRIREAIDDITEAADRLLSRDHPDVYEREREVLVRAYRQESGEDWKEPETGPDEAGRREWEFRWTDGRDGGTRQGPYDDATMRAWDEAGYFREGVEFRMVGRDEWSRLASFR